MGRGFIIILTLFAQLGFAAEPAVVSFYRNQQSLFPSGQASRNDLEAKILRRDFEPWLRVTWNKKSYEIPGETVIRDVQVTRNLLTKETLSLMKDPQDGAFASARSPRRR
jgi:hypothetical protein